MDINLTDKRGSTALHWSCFARSEFALSYILTMNPNLEAKDNLGCTPLMLAIKSVAELKSTRPVRALLLRGSNRNATDGKGQTCWDIIRSEEANLDDR
jgi:ankyrin repeat protein